MSGEWQKSTVLDLITTYKENENLYNPKHKLYYNKQARNKSLDNILVSVRRTKSDVTINEIVKKIQILRTQFGQEMNKIEKSKVLGEELIYVPKIWWFKSLEFISKYQKMRTKPSTPSSVKLEQKADNSYSDNNDIDTIFELVETNEDINEDLDNTYDGQDDTNKAKKRRIEISTKNESLQPRTIEYIINEETSEFIPTNDVLNETRGSEHKVFDSKKFKRKSKAFGIYVGCLMRDLNDDKLFYEAQNEILKVIERMTQKMVQN
ncbi:uncharacterized protein [Chironomus tepperi]|uniref:uncharacterized protein n=1 Tax=Chironomus tepperi TaxID=113505 RepID=UPI00391F8AE7